MNVALQWIRENPWPVRFALLLNLAGTGLIASSFAATSSDFRLITAPGSTAYAICAQNYVLAVTDARGGLIVGTHNCPNWDKSSPAAVAVAEHPWMLWLGLIMSALGFLIQLFAVPSAKATLTVDPPITRAERRRLMRERGDI